MTNPNPDETIALPWPTGSLQIIVLIYAASFFLPVDVLPPRQANDIQLGFGYFYLGVLGMFGQFSSAFPWLANPLFWFGLWRLWNRDGRGAALFGSIATLLAACWIPVGWGRPGVASALGPGYWVWLSSFVLLVVMSSTQWWTIPTPGAVAGVSDRKPPSTDDPETAIRADSRPRDS